ncbi:MAG: NUDIX hydrolase [Microcoleaceae cyanobacterium]
MAKLGKIRVLALGLIQQDNRLFLSQGYDNIKQTTFYRALGGGVDFGEPSHIALEREFQEELQAALTNIKYLGCLENLFEYNGTFYHELIQLYCCDFADTKFYNIDSVKFYEKEREKTALWVPISRFLSGELTLVPEGFLDYCDRM